MLETVRSRIGFLVWISTISFAVLTLASVLGLLMVRQELTMTESYDDLLNYSLEVRRYEKNFLFYHNPENLREALAYLNLIDLHVNRLSEDIILVAGYEPLQIFLADLKTYEQVMRRYLNGSRVDEADMDHIRSLGKRLLDFIQNLIKTKRRRIHRTIMRTSILPVAFFVVFLGFMILVTHLIRKRILGPLSFIHLTTERVGRGDFSPVPFEGRGNDEITRLLEAFNKMAEELETNQEQLVQARKMAALGTFTAGIAHELNNPINNISLTAEAYLEDYSEAMSPEGREMMTDIMEQSARAAEIVKSLLDFSRTEQPVFSVLNIAEVVRRTLHLLKNQLLINNIELKMNLPADLPKINGNFRKLQQVLMNLISNAIQAMPDGGRLTVDAALTPSGELRLDIRDTGQGISPESLPHVFEPFYTTKGVGQGYGLGLAVTYSLIKRHGGRIDVNSAPDRGTTFSIFCRSTRTGAEDNMKERIAVVDDELIVCRRLGQSLSKEGYEVETFPQGRSFLDRLQRQTFDLVFLDLMLPDADGLDLLVKIKSFNKETEVVIITGYGSIETAMDAVRHGAFHYTTKPLKLKEINHLAKAALERTTLRRENARLRESIKGRDAQRPMVGRGPAMQRVFSLIEKVSPLDCNVLIEGRSGTGKALVAQAIHDNSPRRDHPFVSFNCGGFTEELISSELFGYEKGAFTGASATRIGLIESADCGTVFLDEIGEMPLSMQVRLLHVIQDKSILRVGGVRPLDLDIRIIAATNKDIKNEVEAGQFREDLYYRLNVVTIRLPSLRERVEDIPLLMWHFLEKYSLAFNKPITGIHPQAVQILDNYSYPGNVRELENIIERAVALAESNQIQVQDLPQDLRQLELNTLEGEGLIPLREQEKRYILKVLEKTGYNKSLTARILGLPRTTLWRKLKAYGLD